MPSFGCIFFFLDQPVTSVPSRLNRCPHCLEYSFCDHDGQQNSLHVFFILREEDWIPVKRSQLIAASSYDIVAIITASDLTACRSQRRLSSSTRLSRVDVEVAAVAMVTRVVTHRLWQLSRTEKLQ